MKIKPEHYNHMKQEIDKLDKEQCKQHKENLKLDDRVKDLDMRFRFDCLYAAKLGPFVCENIYSYANDNHVDTALKFIVKELKI